MNHASYVASHLVSLFLKLTLYIVNVDSHLVNLFLKLMLYIANVDIILFLGQKNETNDLLFSKRSPFVSQKEEIKRNMHNELQ